MSQEVRNLFYCGIFKIIRLIQIQKCSFNDGLSSQK